MLNKTNYMMLIIYEIDQFPSAQRRTWVYFLESMTIKDVCTMRSNGLCIHLQFWQFLTIFSSGNWMELRASTCILSLHECSTGTFVIKTRSFHIWIKNSKCVHDLGMLLPQPSAMKYQLAGGLTEIWSKNPCSYFQQSTTDSSLQVKTLHLSRMDVQ